MKEKTLALDLQQTAELAKTDEIAFDSLAAAALDTQDVAIIRQFWFTDLGLVSICSAICSGFLFIC